MVFAFNSTRVYLLTPSYNKRVEHHCLLEARCSDLKTYNPCHEDSQETLRCQQMGLDV
jgi:hypothetical protein